MAKLTKYDLDNIITKNKSMFKTRSKITQAQFIKLFGLPKMPKSGTYKELHRAHMKLVAMKEKVNGLMRANGLYLKAKDYNDYFLVLDKPSTKGAVARYSAKVERNEACEWQLDAGLKHRLQVTKTWGTYNRVYDRATGMIRPGMGVPKVVDNAGRTAKTLNRVTSY
jgi:hypothetical protein